MKNARHRFFSNGVGGEGCICCGKRRRWGENIEIIIMNLFFTALCVHFFVYVRFSVDEAKPSRRRMKKHLFTLPYTTF